MFICILEFKSFPFSHVYVAVWIHGSFCYLMDCDSLPFILMPKESQICLARAIQAGFSVLPTHLHDSLSASLFYGASCPRSIFYFLCLFVSACRQWCSWWECLGLYLSWPVLVTSAPTGLCLPEPVLWLDWPLRFLGLWDTSQQQPSGNFQMPRWITHMTWRVQGMPGAT